MIPFLLGAVLCAILFYAGYWRAHTRAARLEEEKLSLLEERKIVLDFMHDMVDAVGDRLTRDELFQRIVHASILSTGALSACIFEKRADSMMRGVAIEGLFPPHRPVSDEDKLKMGRAKFIEQVLKSEEFPVGEGVVGRVAATGQGELIADALHDPRVVKHDDPALVVRSVIAAPILVRKQLIGVLCVCNSADGQPFTGTDYSLVATLAEQAGLAVHNTDFIELQVAKQRLDVDLTLASEVQQMLLPKTMPRLTGIDVDARYLAAQTVTGDLYDVFPLGGGRIGVAVADVSGKGLSASLHMAICRTLLHQIAGRFDDSPARALSELNRALAADVRDGIYITMTYAIVDPLAGQVILARAGHELPLFMRQDLVTRQPRGEYVVSEGMPLGLVPPGMFDQAIEDKIVAFAPGDVLMLYTDGLNEAPNRVEQEFGSARLSDALRSASHGKAKEINDAVLQAVQRFTGASGLRDDFTLLTVKRL
jgi:phosphoserine phosphatase RsbU/P